MNKEMIEELMHTSTENILLRAVDLGLGAVWCGIHPQKASEKKVAKALYPLG